MIRKFLVFVSISFSVNDADQSDSVVQGLQYILINDPKNNSPFEISNNGELSVKPDMLFDREFQNEHIVTAVAGSYKENTTFCVKVHIDDQNDHSPNFTQPVYEAEVLDSISVGTSVLALYATDEDEGKLHIFEKHDYVSLLLIWFKFVLFVFLEKGSWRKKGYSLL